MEVVTNFELFYLWDIWGIKNLNNYFIVEYLNEYKLRTYVNNDIVFELKVHLSKSDATFRQNIIHNWNLKQLLKTCSIFIS